MRDAVVSFLSCAEFEAFADKHPEVYKSLIRVLAERLRETDTVVAAGSFLSLKGRVAQTMLELANHFGQEVVPGRIVIRQKIRAERSCRHGRHRTREPDPGPQRLAAQQSTEPPVWLLLP